jgi:trans-2-enoyl-CoA reductase
MKKLVIHQYKSSQDTLQLEEFFFLPLEKNEVRIQTLYTPIHPADLNALEGKYGLMPAPLPFYPGNEGVGRVIEVGESVNSLKVGDLVYPLKHRSCWASHWQLKVEDVLVLPSDLSPLQACMLRVNPLSAWLMLEYWQAALKRSDLQQEGSSLILNAANSAIGQCMIQLAKKLKITTIALVRNAQWIEPLKELGANYVLVDNNENLSELCDITQMHPPCLALNAVGADSAIRILELLCPHSIMLTYGAMSRQALKIPNKYLIFKDVLCQGFWLTHAVNELTSEQLSHKLMQIAQMIECGELVQKIGGVYPINQLNEALAHARQDSRQGKILLDWAL